MTHTMRSPELVEALAGCERGPGWNRRRREVRKFIVGGKYGVNCTLFCVPAACWVYRRQQQHMEAWQREQ